MHGLGIMAYSFIIMGNFIAVSERRAESVFPIEADRIRVFLNGCELRGDMEIKRLWHSIRLLMIFGAGDRAEYLRKHRVFHHVGAGCSIMNRKVPLYARLISLGDNVHIASNVTFVTHDITHVMLNNRDSNQYQERIGCIEIGNNVFIGTNCILLSNIKIGSNCIIGAGSIVTKDIPDNSVAVGTPARRICSLEEYLLRREKNKKYPQQFAPKKQRVNEELEQWCWTDFVTQRKEP